jgi:NADH:ubiquinone oxidoreductase subunit 6 (subunit J)
LFVLELFMIVRVGTKESLWERLPADVSGLTTSTFGSVETVSKTLFQEYLYPFELTGVLLLIAVVGAVVIAKKERGDDVVVTSSGDRIVQGDEDQKVVG